MLINILQNAVSMQTFCSQFSLQDLKNSLSLFIVTHDSQKIIEDDNLKGLAYSSLWGLAKVISMDIRIKCRRIDIDSKDDFEILMKEIILIQRKIGCIQGRKKICFKIEKKHNSKRNF